MSQPDIAFTVFNESHKSLLWNEAAEEAARELGWRVRLPNSPPGYNPTQDEWKDFIGNADALITTWGAPLLDENLLAGNDRLKFVGHAAGSVAAVISPEVYNRGIRVCSANREMAEAVARWGLMMTLVGLRGLVDHAKLGAFSPMRWEHRDNGRDARNSTIGIWGYGDISKSLIELLRPLQPGRIMVCSRSLTEEHARAEGLVRVDLDTLFQQSDVIHVFQSLTEQTTGLVGEKQLNSMKDNAVLINAGRAHLIQETALLDALRNKNISGIFDVHYEEPLPKHSPFNDLPNVILTPHCAGKENYCLFVKSLLMDFKRLLDGDALLNEISPRRALGMTNESLRK